MKKWTFFVAAFLVISCNSNSGNDTPADQQDEASEAGNTRASIVFEANGQQVNTDGLNVRLFVWDDKTAEPLINIMSDVKKDKRAINVNLNGSKPGTYIFSTQNDPMGTVGTFWTDYNNILDSYIFETGEFVLTQVDTEKGLINGTFSGTAVGKDGKQIKISNGRLINLKLSPGVMNLSAEADKLTQ